MVTLNDFGFAQNLQMEREALGLPQLGAERLNDATTLLQTTPQGFAQNARQEVTGTPLTDDRFGFLQNMGQQENFVQQNVDALQPAISDADTRAQLTQDQLAQAGMLNLANQLRGARRNIAFDTARRGTLGGSRSIERGEQASQDAQRQVGSVQAQAQAQAEAQRQSELAGIYGFDALARQGDPFADILAQQELQRINDQAQSAQGQFEVDTSRENIRNAGNMNDASNIFGALSTLGTGISSGIVNRAEDRSYEDMVRALTALPQQPLALAVP